MSELLEFSVRQSAQPKMRIGLLRLTDGAPVIAAHEFGFFAECAGVSFVGGEDFGEYFAHGGAP